jgi:translation initiation factor IF-2
MLLIKNYAAAAGVPIHTDTVIYRIMDEIRSRVQALLPVIIEHRVFGEAVVQQLFEVRGKKTNIQVAGCRVTNGVIERHKPVKILRDDVEVYNGVSLISSLRMFTA